jgi:predicted transcriptional regulator
LQPEEDALDHPRREKLYNIVQDRPGLNWNQLKRESGLSVGALLFHLERLEDADLILRRDSTNDSEVLLFTPENVDLWRDPSTRVLFGNESTRRIAQIITENPGCTTNDIADRVDVHPVTVRYHVDKLDDHKLIVREKEGRGYRYEPTDRLDAWMHEVVDK